MQCKSQDHELARKLRGQGLSLREIASQLGVSLSSVSSWVRDVVLDQTQQTKIRTRSTGNLVKARQVWESKSKDRHVRWEQEARDTFLVLSKAPAFLLGLGLYLGEGHKTSKSFAGLTNADPAILLMGLRFFKCLGAAENKLRARIYMTSPSEESRIVWSNKLGLSKDQVFTRRKSKAVVSRKDIGVVLVHSTELFIKIMVWCDMAMGR